MSTGSPSPVPGRFRLLDHAGAEIEAADATFAIEQEALVVLPRQQTPLRLDFADLDGVEHAEHVFRVLLGSGERVEASMLGSRHRELSDALAAALGAYQVRNLLLEEAVGGESFGCDVAGSGAETPAEVRVWATSLSVMPKVGTPYAIPFGELSGATFDEKRYAIDLATGEGTVSLLRLGKRTRPCLALIESRLGELNERGAAAIAYLVPLPSLTARRLAQLLRDGVPVTRARIDAVDRAIWPALSRAAIPSPKLRQSFETLSALCPPSEVAVGIKETNARIDSEAAEAESTDGRSEEGATGDEGTEAGEVPAEKTPMTGRVTWYAFPVYGGDRRSPGNAVAVEAVTRGGRATYLFRIAPPEVYREVALEELSRLARERIRSLSRAMVALGFKREPIYLSDDKLQTGPYARYRLALRLSAPLQASRAAFVGRAIHGPGWKEQIDAALARALG